MKKTKITLFTLALLGASSQSFATGASCGIGGALTEGESGVGPHFIAQALDNFFFSSVTSSMTSGTFGCNTNVRVGSINAKTVREAEFINTNINTFVAEVAIGSGEAVDNYLTLKGVNDTDKQEVASLLKANFSSFAQSANALEIAVKINDILKANSYTQYVA